MTKEELQSLWRDKSNWRFYFIYCCREDPRLIVPRRIKWFGWTVNFAHLRAVGLLALVCVVVCLPFFIESKLSVATPVVLIVTMVIVIVGIVVLCAYMSSRTG
jgi:hypothetical protein